MPARGKECVSRFLEPSRSSVTYEVAVIARRADDRSRSRVLVFEVPAHGGHEQPHSVAMIDADPPIDLAPTPKTTPTLTATASCVDLNNAAGTHRPSGPGPLVGTVVRLSGTRGRYVVGGVGVVDGLVGEPLPREEQLVDPDAHPGRAVRSGARCDTAPGAVNRVVAVQSLAAEAGGLCRYCHGRHLCSTDADKPGGKVAHGHPGLHVHNRRDRCARHRTPPRSDPNHSSQIIQLIVSHNLMRVKCRIAGQVWIAGRGSMVAAPGKLGSTSGGCRRAARCT